jgi:hypothetical protein
MRKRKGTTVSSTVPGLGGVGCPIAPAERPLSGLAASDVGVSSVLGRRCFPLGLATGNLPERVQQVVDERNEQSGSRAAALSGDC